MVDDEWHAAGREMKPRAAGQLAAIE